MTSVLGNESELYIERGGPAYRFMQRVGMIGSDDPLVHRRILVFLAITWVPTLLLSIWDGYALGPTPRQSFLFDFATYARFFIGVPLLVIAEVVVGPRLTSAGLQFIQAGFVRPEDYPAFDRAIARVVRWREAAWPELIILGMALVGAWTITPEIVYGDESASWVAISSAAGTRFTLAGLWQKFIAVPIIQFLLLRWLWRLIIWIRFLGAVARIDLDLVPTHADQAGGLGFLGNAHIALGIFAFSLSSVLSADAGFRIVFEGAAIETFKVPAVVLLVATEVICLGPLLVFVPIMVRKRREALREYGMLVGRYNRAFHEKWVASNAPEGESILGSGDIQSLADLGGSFEFIRSMKMVPFSLRVIIQLAVLAAFPAVPLLPLAMPWEEILKVVAGAVL